MKQIFISSYDYTNFREPRAVVHYDWGSIDDQDALIVKIDVPVETGYLDKPYATTLFLLNRYPRDVIAFKELSSFPLNVHVLAAKQEFTDLVPTFAEFTNIAWASLYDNFEDAKSYRII